MWNGHEGKAAKRKKVEIGHFVKGKDWGILLTPHTLAAHKVQRRMKGERKGEDVASTQES